MKIFQLTGLKKQQALQGYLEQPKEVTLKKSFWEKQAQSQANITEGAFAWLKTDFGVRRFLARGKRKCLNRTVLPGHGFQPEKALDKTGKRTIKNPSFRNSDRLAQHQQNATFQSATF